jgi:hypothetical protein
LGKTYRDEVIAGEDEGGFADATGDSTENKSGVDDPVPMSNHSTVEIGQQHVKNGSWFQNNMRLINAGNLALSIGSVFVTTKFWAKAFLSQPVSD